MISKIFISVLFLCLAKNIIGQSVNCGIVIVKFEVFDSSQNKFVHAKGQPDLRIYYKDSIVIIPSVGSISSEENGVETKYEEKDLYYTYVNLRSKKITGMSAYTKDSLYFSKYNATYYEYPAFSKDSFFTKKYMNLDTAGARTWGFFFERNEKSKPEVTDSTTSIKDKLSPIILPDTLINGISLHREKHTNYDKEGKIASISIPYYRCDIQDWMLIFIKKNEKGCLVTRIDFTLLNTNTKQLDWVSQQYEFLSRKLTTEEIAVFSAWEKNEKNYPVTK
jgi:hypothetical protein